MDKIKYLEKEIEKIKKEIMKDNQVEIELQKEDKENNINNSENEKIPDVLKKKTTLKEKSKKKLKVQIKEINHMT